MLKEKFGLDRKKSMFSKYGLGLVILCLALCACGSSKEDSGSAKASEEEQISADELRELQEQLKQQQQELAEQQEQFRQEQLAEQKRREEEELEEQRRREQEQEMNNIDAAYYNLFTQMVSGNIYTRSYSWEMDADNSLLYYFYKCVEGQEYYDTYGYIFSNMKAETKTAVWKNTLAGCNCNYAINQNEDGGYYISVTLSNKNTVNQLVMASENFLSDKLQEQNANLKESGLMGALEGFGEGEGFWGSILSAAKGAAKNAAFDLAGSVIKDVSGQESGAHAEAVSKLYEQYLNNSQQVNAATIYFNVEQDAYGNYVIPDTILFFNNAGEALYYENENAVYLLEYLLLGMPLK